MASQPQQPVTTNTVQGTDAGTDTRVRTLDQTQGTGYNKDGYAVGIPLQDETGAVNPTIRKNPETGELYSAAGLEDPAPPKIQPGAGSSDDAGGKNDTGATATTASPTLLITPRPNILDQYPSYTWQASVYMLTPEQYEVFQKNPRQKPNNYNLLFQSGGAANSSGAVRGAQAGTAAAFTNGTNTDGRNPFFTNDFYIDNITFTNFAAGKGTGLAHTLADLKFTVVEPSNISLLDRLYLAAQDLSPVRNKKINYMAVQYLMIIRFYAQDETGNIVQVKQGSSDAAGGDRYTLVEKYIPFQVAGISFSITSNLVSYDWECTPVGQNAGLRIRKATIPADVELTGGKVDDLLSGSVVYSKTGTADTAPAATADTNSSNQANANTPPPPKVSASVITRGLMDTMNEQEQRYVREGRQTYANVYKIQYTPEAEALIKNATITKPHEIVNKAAVPAAAAASQNTQTSSPDKQAMTVTSRNYPITAGMQLVQAIELIIRNSNYITDQANIVFTEDGAPKPNPKAAGENQGVRWFNIIPSARPIGGQYDEKVNDYAYNITFTIATYDLQQFNSAYFPATKFKGIHKQYHYWFTGQNTSVLDYKETFNTQYLWQVSGSPDQDSNKTRVDKKITSSMRDIPLVMQVARSSESSQSAQNRANELAANAAQNIYNPGDLAEARLQIIGDPAWIMQGSIIGVADPKTVEAKPFNDDGSINFDMGEVLYEIAWQRPQDYSLSTGLADPYSQTPNVNGSRQPLQSRVYRCISVISEFRGGNFTQTIEGGLYVYPLASGNNRAPDSAQPNANLPSTATQDNSGTTNNSDNYDPNARNNDSTGDTQRSNADTPTIVGGGVSNTGVLPSTNTSTVTMGNFLNSSIMQNASGGASGLRLASIFDRTVVGTGSGISNTFNPVVNDFIQPVLPPAPAVSNGVIVATGIVIPTTAQVKDPQEIARDA